MDDAARIKELERLVMALAERVAAASEVLAHLAEKRERKT